MGARSDAEQVMGYPIGEGLELAVNRIPDQERQPQEGYFNDLRAGQIAPKPFGPGNGIKGQLMASAIGSRLAA